jgi:tol-pal system protein YbgF
MKKVFILLVCSAFIACSQTNDAVKQSINNLNSEIINLQKALADLKVDVDESQRMSKVNSENINVNATAIANLKNEITYLSDNNMLPKSNKNSEDKEESSVVPEKEKVKNNEIIIIQDNFSDKSSLYSYAYELYKNGKYFECRKKFNEFLKLYPNDDLSDNALYWISESYYAQREYQKSIDTIEKLIGKYPSGNKVPDATFKLAIDYKELGNTDKAISILKKLIADYPDSRVTEIANKKLSEWSTPNE